MNDPLVTIVVLSYSWTRYLREVLQSIVSQSYPNLEILLVDNNGPALDEVVRIAKDFPAVRLIQNPENLGFSGGMNTGITAAAGRYTYLSEDDVVLRSDCIAALVAFMEGRDDVGLAAPIMYNKGDGTIRSAGGLVSQGTVYSMKILGEGQTDTGQFREPFDVTYIPGASIFGRTMLLREMKGFREDFFIYHEDTELCIRVRKSGLRIVTVPAARIDHFEPPGGAPSNFVTFLRYRNFYAAYILHAPGRVLPSFLIRYGPLDLLRACVQNPRHVPIMLKAWGWVLANMPGLLRDRDGRPLPAHAG